MLVYLIPTSHVPLQVEILHRLKRSLLAARSHFAMTKSSNTERERGLLQNPARQREDLLKIQQYREREDVFKIQQDREREREDFFKIQQDTEGAGGR